ncbi:hypothetical protein BV22DRAFT_1037376 [Leucogyrophana mollusca]|uniref:Uncharacterized protein n=1 Tax=Leucogyrophana mollusca TaxID=85980 RepID=A0ACB8B9P8_9AGAM|nr:hypothetical protein BV22DRAFT_1037376 [Leucogyrophana mollusca]
MERCKELKKEKVGGPRNRATRPERVTIIELGDLSCDKSMPVMSASATLLACVPTAVSASTCAASAIWGDWYTASMILLGIVSNGLACLVIGSGTLSVDTFTDQTARRRQGDGILLGDEIVILKGREEAVNAITKGKFVLDMERRGRDERRATQGEDQEKGADEEDKERPEYRKIGCCSLLLTLQLLFQLLLIPQGTLFGQIMFLSSLAVSWAYNSFLASLEKEKIQADILCDVLNRPPMKRYELGTRTMMAVFVVLVLAPSNPSKLLDELLPNDIEVWRIWKGMVLERMQKEDSEKLQFDEAHWPEAAMNLSEGDKELLAALLSDAKAAWVGYASYSPISRSDDEQ